jgi:hypothetical protein
MAVVEVEAGAEKALKVARVAQEKYLTQYRPHRHRRPTLTTRTPRSLDPRRTRCSKTQKEASSMPSG